MLQYCSRLLTDEEREEIRKFRSMNKALRLCVCISANVGGTATITGTGPNIIIQGQMDEYVPSHLNVILILFITIVFQHSHHS